MSKKNAKVGLSADLFDTGGRPMFGNAVLSLFSDAGVAWSIVPVTGGQLPATAFTDYEALLIAAVGARLWSPTAEQLQDGAQATRWLCRPRARL
jgi:hypothetical protein